MKLSFIKHSFLLLLLGFFVACNIYNDENQQGGQNCELINTQNLSTCETDNGNFDYCLSDINPNSCTYRENIGKSFFNNQVTVHYFGHQS